MKIYDKLIKTEKAGLNRMKNKKTRQTLQLVRNYDDGGFNNQNGYVNTDQFIQTTVRAFYLHRYEVEGFN